MAPPWEKQLKFITEHSNQNNHNYWESISDFFFVIFCSDQARPKPGKVHPAIANRFKVMITLSWKVINWRYPVHVTTSYTEYSTPLHKCKLVRIKDASNLDAQNVKLYNLICDSKRTT